MTDKLQFPTLFNQADNLSNDSQKNYLSNIRINFWLGLGSALLSLIGLTSSKSAYISAIFILLSILVTIYMILAKKDQTWYRARALAESIKSLTLKYSTGAEPFSLKLDDKIVDNNLRQKQENLLKEHTNLSEDFSHLNSNIIYITESMRDIRKKTLIERKNFYLTERIEDQLAFYTSNARRNKKKSKIWFSVMISCQLLAMIFAIARAMHPEFIYWPADIFLLASSYVFTWLVTKKHRELSASYTLTAYEIAKIKDKLNDIKTNEEFEIFVADSENAFSREHTQWLARQDSL
ncbi:DUF4231 domain-containing protein [Acinetobacter calcoaceticus]|uniref:DUF4231 domain-containing protein n=1 Tax=Acinetobacter calcoaceticus TaxID=471 RepID=UPI003AF48F7C